MSRKSKREFSSPDGTTWLVEATSPGASNAMILFRHPNGERSGLDRYNWFIWNGAEARSVTARLDKNEVLGHISDDHLTRLFRRSMPVSTVYSPPDVLSADN
jgi:hypothetical protein